MRNPTCATCKWWKQDFGTFCANGWSGYGRNEGYCYLEPKGMYKKGDAKCSHWEEK